MNMNVSVENNWVDNSKDENVKNCGMLVKPTPIQLAWQEAEMGVIFHYDLHVFNEEHYHQETNRRVPCEDIDIFNPGELDTDQWVQTAKDAGARFALLTASHETGFRLWQSDVNPYCLKAVKWGDGKRDIVGDFMNSCRKAGIKPGIYIGTRWNAQLGIWDFKVTERSPVSQAQYNDMIEKEVAEICSNYGPLFEVWFDGGAHGPKQGGPDVLGVFEKYQKDCLFYHNLERADARWGGSESGTVGYPCWATFPYPSIGAGESAPDAVKKDNYALLKQGDPNGSYWMPAMSDAPLRNHNWFWDKDEEHKLYSLDALVDMYYRSVGQNSTLIMGLTPDNRGLIPDADVKRCKAWGDSIKQRFSNCLSHTSGTGKVITMELTRAEVCDHLILQEDICEGERVRNYVVEAEQDGMWHEICNGSCIGHKRIHRLNTPVAASRLRLRIEHAIATPLISNFAIYGIV